MAGRHGVHVVGFAACRFPSVKDSAVPAGDSLDSVLPARAAGVGAVCGGSWSASEAGVALDAGEAAGAVRAGLGRLASACTVRAEYNTTSATIATAETPAARQIHSGAFRPKLRVFLFITISQFY